MTKRTIIWNYKGVDMPSWVGEPQSEEFPAKKVLDMLALDNPEADWCLNEFDTEEEQTAFLQGADAVSGGYVVWFSHGPNDTLQDRLRFVQNHLNLVEDEALESKLYDSQTLYLNTFDHDHTLCVRQGFEDEAYRELKALIDLYVMPF